ncbi:MAG: TonB-dependent receptor domain-containing protein, partial [Chitinophagaceae bacterium]
LEKSESSGERFNSDYQSISGFGRLGLQVNRKLSLSISYSLLHNRIHMPGGLTDQEFKQDPLQSFRARNWLTSPWNILAFKLKDSISRTSTLYLVAALNFSSRSLVWKNEDGGPQSKDSINPATLNFSPREIQREEFQNFTIESRWRRDYGIDGRPQTLSAGVRFYWGTMARKGGGPGSTGSDFDLHLYPTPENPDYGYNLHFKTTNLAIFGENIFRLTSRIFLIPGIRWEFLDNEVQGYTDTSFEPANKIRSLLLAGSSLQIKIHPSVVIYGNMAQAYRPLTYEFLTPVATVSRIDPNMRDSYGYNADLGIRGSFQNWLQFDISGFLMQYNRRVGIISDPFGHTIRTNVANSLAKGVESYWEINVSKILFLPHSWKIFLYHSMEFN